MEYALRLESVIVVRKRWTMKKGRRVTMKERVIQGNRLIDSQAGENNIDRPVQRASAQLLSARVF